MSFGRNEDIIIVSCAHWGVSVASEKQNALDFQLTLDYI